MKNENFWLIPLTELINLHHARVQGLTDAEARTHIKQYGTNEISPPIRLTIFRQIAIRFKNPLVILLLATSAVSLALNQKSDFYIIIAMVFISIGLDFYQEYSANQSTKKLQDTITLRVKVMRDGALKTIKAKYLSIGDVVHLKAGDVIPADGRLIYENHLFVNQSILTGESFPVEKKVVDLPPSKHANDLENATNSLFMGTSVISGEAHMLVTRTGNTAFLGKIAENLKKTPPPSQFEINTKKFGFFLMRVTIFLVLFILAANFFFDRPWLETFLFALALAVGMTPEFLPMVMSVTLARGAKVMSKKHVIVKRLSAIHDLGGMNILCTDKTGTLTEAKIKLIGHINARGTESERIFTLAYINSFFETGLKNPMDMAIIEHEKIDLSAWQKIDEIPFDFERRRVSVLVDHQDQRQIIVKGAPEDIIAQCTHYEDGASHHALDDDMRRNLIQIYKNESKKGFRLLGIAWQAVPKSHQDAVLHDEANLIFAGFALFYDAPKIEAAKTITDLHHQNVEVYILTGDSEDVTLHLCHELKIPVKGMLTGHDMAEMDKASFIKRLANTNLYCRVNPAQKQRIVESLKNLGHVVGYMGDGINDAPALHTANIGISVDTGADVAKEASDLILLRHNLAVIHDAIIEGRKIYANIIKYLMMMTSSNFGNMFSMAGASVILPFLPMLPTQILLNNLLYDASQTAIPFDHVDKESTLAPQHWNLKLLLKFMLVMGLLSSVFDFLFFFIMWKVMDVSPSLFQTGWFMESLATQVLIIFIIRTRKSFYHSRPHYYLVILAGLLVSTAMIIPYTALGARFDFVHPPLSFFMIIIGIVISYLTLAEVTKKLFYKLQ